MGIASRLHRTVNMLIFKKLKYIQILVHLIFKKYKMSIQLLSDKVYTKCELKLVGFDKIEGTPITQIHNTIRKEFELELRAIINSFVAELSKHPLPEKKKEIALNFKELFCSKEFKGIFKHDINYSEEYKMKCIKECEINDPRTSKKFVIEKNYDLSEKSKDFYCVFSDKHGWNSWVKEFSPAKYIISVEHNNTDNSIVQRYEIRDLPKILNSVPVLEIENYIPRVTILEEISNLFEQKNKKVNITGISGIGKTFLAKHFVEHYSEKFSHIVWLNCASGTVKAFTQGKGVKLLDIMGLASEYKSYKEGNMSEEGLMSMVLGRLQNIKVSSLFVLDNIDKDIYNYEDEIQLASNWKILTTSQEKLDGFHNYSTPYFDEESIHLFYKYYTLEKDDDNLIRLLSAIEYHTLTIELLAKTAEQRQLNIIQLVNRFIENGVNVVEKTKVIADHGKERKKTEIENIERYLELVFDTSLLTEEECKILLNIALLQSDYILTDLFQEVYLNNTQDKKMVDVFAADLYSLIKKGWVQVENNKIRIHGLVKKVIINKYYSRNDFYHLTIKYLTKVLKQSFDVNSLEQIDYMVLSESMLENIKEETSDSINLKAFVSVHYHNLGLFEKSKKNLSQLLSVKDEDVYNIIIRLHNLSITSIEQHNYTEALMFSEKISSSFSKDIKEKMYVTLINFLTSFFEENKIETIKDFENKFNYSDLTQLVNIELDCQSNVVVYGNTNIDLLERIKNLKNIISIRQTILDIFEDNISEKIISSVGIYKDLLLKNVSLFDHIGTWYSRDLKNHQDAELFFKRTLNIKEKIFKKGHFSLSVSYHHLTLLYLNWKNIEQARYYLEKNREICDTLSTNHPLVNLFQKDAYIFKKLENESYVSENIEKIIQSKFDNLFNQNQDFTALTLYHHTLALIYFENKDYEKAITYFQKEMSISDSENVNIFDLVLLNIHLGVCYLYVKNFSRAMLQHHNATLLKNKVENLKDIELLSKPLDEFRDALIESAVLSDFIPIIETMILSELKKLENKYISIFSKLPSKNDLSIVVKEIFIFLSNLENIISEKPVGGINLYITEYEKVCDSLIKNNAGTDYLSINASNIHFEILDEYCQTIIDLFVKYKKWDLVCKYSLMKLFLNEKHFETKNRGMIYYTISYCYFNLKQPEQALEAIHQAIAIYSKACEIRYDEMETAEKLKALLKGALDLEKLIKEELGRFRV